MRTTSNTVGERRETGRRRSCDARITEVAVGQPSYFSGQWLGLIPLMDKLVVGFYHSRKRPAVAPEIRTMYKLDPSPSVKFFFFDGYIPH